MKSLRNGTGHRDLCSLLLVLILTTSVSAGELWKRLAPNSELSPGQIYEINLPLTAISAGIKKGERIGIVVLSNFNPAIVRNANTGKVIGKDTSFQKANIRIYYGADYPSSLTLTTR